MRQDRQLRRDDCGVVHENTKPRIGLWDEIRIDASGKMCSSSGSLREVRAGLKDNPKMTVSTSLVVLWFGLKITRPSRELNMSIHQEHEWRCLECHVASEGEACGSLVR